MNEKKKMNPVLKIFLTGLLVVFFAVVFGLISGGIFLGVSVGATANAETFLDSQTLYIIFLGLAAFCFSTMGGVLFGKADAKRAICLAWRKAKGKQRLAGRLGVRGASRARRNGDPACGKEMQHGFAFDIRQRDAEDVRGALFGEIASDLGALQAVDQRL